jgi:iron-sulfur cluster assembly accessory protein
MIKGGGCAGFSYNWSTVDVEKVKENDEIIPLSNGNFVIDGTSLMFVAGTTIDYKEEVFGSYMTISNPNVKSSCGCGESFGV